MLPKTTSVTIRGDLEQRVTASGVWCVIRARNAAARCHACAISSTAGSCRRIPRRSRRRDQRMSHRRLLTRPRERAGG